MESLVIENDMLKGVWQYNNSSPKEKLYPYLLRKRGASTKTFDVSMNGKSNNYKPFTIAQFMDIVVNKKFNESTSVRMMPASGDRSKGGGWLMRNLTVEKAVIDSFLLVEEQDDRLVIEPVLYDSGEELYCEAAKIRKTLGDKIPKGQQNPEKIERTTIQFKRDASVVAYVLEQANGACECCGKASPFERKEGEPFLEVHHVKHLSEGGSDTKENAVGLCPNCHRELHYGANQLSLMRSLYKKVLRLEVE